MRKILFLSVILILNNLVIYPHTGTITNISVQPRTDGSGMIDVHFHLSGEADSYNILMDVSFDAGDTYSPIPTAYLSGDLQGISPGRWYVVWDGYGSFPNEYSTQTRIKIVATADENNVTDSDAVTFIDENFQSFADHSAINQNGWSSIAEVGNRVWICRTFQNNHYAQATAFNSIDDVNIMWLITPPINLDAMTSPTFEFESAQAFYTHPGFSIYISHNFDGTNVATADWQPLNATLAGLSDPGNQWIHSGYIDLSLYEGIVHIAWRHEGSHSNGQTGTFRVNIVKLYEAP